MKSNTAFFLLFSTIHICFLQMWIHILSKQMVRLFLRAQVQISMRVRLWRVLPGKQIKKRCFMEWFITWGLLLVTSICACSTKVCRWKQVWTCFCTLLVKQYSWLAWPCVTSTAFRHMPWSSPLSIALMEKLFRLKLEKWEGMF